MNTKMVLNTRITLDNYMCYLLLFSIYLHFGTLKLVDSSNISCLSYEREALLIFKKGLTDPTDRLSLWLGNNCCEWTGITCDTNTGHVIALDLQSPSPNFTLGYEWNHDSEQYPLSYWSSPYDASAVGGEINKSLVKLKYLTHLDLSMNNFQGTVIPSFIGLLENLRYLNLWGAYFEGKILTQFGNLSKLESLNLNSGFSYGSGANDLTFLSGLSSLKYLNLGSVDLSLAKNNWLEMINMLTSLKELHLPYCGLSNIPVSLSAINFTSLSHLDLSNNGFNSSIPKWLFNLTSLVYLDMNTNSLHGNLPDEFSNLISIQHIDMSYNLYIDGKLPKNLGKLCRLRYLKLSNNNIKGELTEMSDELLKCSNSSLELLSLWDNSFTGSIPNSIGNLTLLQEFYLANNEMNGTIPESLGQLYYLTILDISGNDWHGVVTEAHLFNLTSLKGLWISTSSTTLSFNVSSKWIPPFKLKYLSIKYCQLGPKFPSWLRNQNELKSITLQNTMLSDRVPDWFCELDLKINQLSFSNNELSGRVPNSFAFQDYATVDLRFNKFGGLLPNFTGNLGTLILKNNSFNGPIHVDIKKTMPNLYIYDVSENCLSGTIPVSLGEITSLVIVDLSNNRLFGKIPSSMGLLSSLKLLSLGNNKLYGEIPSSLQNCTLMRGFDLGENNFQGEIPSWIGEKMRGLSILRLRGNSFSGYVPLQLCTLTELQLLDLAQNNLYGQIPSCLGQLKGMSIDLIAPIYEGQILSVVTKGRKLLYQRTLASVNLVDFSGNNLSGKIPKELKKLSRLGTLNLSMNHLTGNIPEEIGNLERLETLDLSKNQLYGSIPLSMGSMSFLSSLNLSYNNLSGRIPTSTQLMTLDDPSIYRGNIGLCGFPIATKCPGDDETPRSPNVEDDEDGIDDDDDDLWFHVSIVIGVIVGFWGFFGVLFTKRSWRIALFGYVEYTIEKYIPVFGVGVDRKRRTRRS